MSPLNEWNVDGGRLRWDGCKGLVVMGLEAVRRWN